MTLPLDILISFVLGGALSLACRVQLRRDPRPWYATRYFGALLSLMGLVFLPAAAYRYFFHPDWSVMYLFSTSASAGLIGLAGLVLDAGAAIGAFALGNYSARMRREWLAVVAMVSALAGIVGVALLGEERVLVVGQMTQWERGYGLQPLSESDLYWASLVMGGCVMVGWLQLMVSFIREGVALGRASR